MVPAINKPTRVTRYTAVTIGHAEIQSAITKGRYF